MKYYFHPRCGTCKKSSSFLDKHGLEPKEIDITAKAPSKTELKKMLKVYVGNIPRLFNTSGMQYRELGIKDKLDKGMKESEAIDLLSQNGMLVKRPFVLFKEGGLVGFKEDEWKAALL